MSDRILVHRFWQDLVDMATPLNPTEPDDVTPATEGAIEEDWRAYDDDNRSHFHVDELPEWLRWPTDY